MTRTKSGNASGRGLISREMAQNCFGSRLRRAREAVNQTQESLAKRISRSRVVIANFETGKTAPAADVAVRLALILSEDPKEYLLLAAAQRACCSGGEVDDDLLAAVNQLLGSAANINARPGPPGVLETHLSLLDFPHAFTPLTVVVGDKREDDPQNAGDLFAFSASTVDDRWLLSLGLPRETEKISDKVVMTAAHDKAWLKKHFSKQHILCIGSPASNLFSRMHNNSFLFRFAITREADDKWQKTLREIAALGTHASLLSFREKHEVDLKQRMRLFKPPGFVDFNYQHLRLGMDLSFGKDFGVVSLGQNPYAEDEAYFAIVVAGVHHPGTAHAVRFLSEPSHFAKHPFGGIIEVDVPANDVETSRVSWHSKIELSKAYWHTVGTNKLEYTPESMLMELQRWRERLSSLVTDVELRQEELEQHIRLINRLARITAEPTSAVTGSTGAASE